MTQPTSGRWWRRGRDQAQADAREAAGLAAQALIDLDRLQTQIAADVAVLAELDGTSLPPSVVRQVSAAWAPVQQEANAALALYMTAVGSADLDADPEEPVARHAAEAFRSSGQQLGHSVVRLQQFGQQHGQVLGQARAAQAVVPERVHEARVALTSAERAVAGAQAQGYAAREAVGLLDEARAALDGLEHSAGRAGILDAAADVVALSGRIEAEVDSLPGRAAAIAQRLTTVRTFLQVTETHLAAVPDLLSELRRGFVHPSIADLDSVTATAEKSLRTARDLLARAAELVASSEQRFSEAEAAVAGARAAVDVAAKAAQAPAHRLTALREVAQDPEEPLRQARRVVRDAQRFAIAGPTPPSRQVVSRLDALGAQLDTAPIRLVARNRPDFWAYLSELTQITDSARRVVEEIRASR